jgi:hypothetical protein
MKNSNDIIGNRTRDLPAYSAVLEEKEEEEKLCNLNLAYFITAYDIVHIRIFIITFHLFTSNLIALTSISEGPQNMCSVNIY